ncbi:FadR family transcriptional regulator [Nordella sp. HKS 07]|uniref:FadR/GntR family transcriptional regulator n=1 Tax=Nordella sp. HKS 07 TaxID=2712222 RepID=UPI0013E19640|nr:FadR/GntR family transcriptional regulator [Nordella sp. HKS 07]QIG49764.1 FadR family transcriptional regulator [Nordella sp. HKS 07]
MKSKPSNSGLLSPVKSQTLDSAVIDALAAYVEEARIEPGDKLPSERMLCERLQVSRPTVREALKRWEALGIVEMRKGSGVYLRKAVGRNIVHVPLVLSRSSNVKDLLHGLQVRRALEGEAAAICAASASADRIATIEKALDRMEAAHAVGNSSEEDWEYHQSIIEATGNPLFTQIVQSMRDLVHQFWENPLQIPNFAEASFPFHRTMFDAIARRDPATARAEALKIIDSVGSEIREAYPGEA